MASDLTPKQEAFVLAYIETGNASEAYRRAYDSKSTDNAIHVEASKLLKNPKVTLRVQMLQKKAEVRAILTLEEHMDELKSLRELAKQNGQVSAAITAEVKRGELRKFYVKQVETGNPGDFEHLTDDELREFIATGSVGAGEGEEETSAKGGVGRPVGRSGRVH